MYYKKVKDGDLVIEFHNNWLGVETVIINGQIVSKKSSIMGTHHHFSVFEKGDEVRFVLTTKLDGNMQVLLDLRKNGLLVQEDVLVNFGNKSKQLKNPSKKKGMELLHKYALEEASEAFKIALDIDVKDPEIYFYLACIHSLREEARQGFDYLKKAVENKLKDMEMILDHDMLAYLRMHDAFEGFLSTNFSEYDESLF